MVVARPLYDQLVEKSTAYEAAQRNDELKTARRQISQLSGQIKGLLTILKGKLAPGERIPDSAWNMLIGDTAFVASESEDDNGLR